MATKAKKTSKNTKVDWSLAPRGVVSGTVQGAVGLAAVGAVGELAGVSPLLAAAGAVTGAMGHVIVGANHDYAPSAIMYRLGCWLGAGGWLTWAWADGPIWQHPNGIAALAVGAVGAGVLSPLGKATKRKASDTPGMALAVRPGGSVAVAWEARFKRVCRVAVQVSDVRAWDNKAGFDLVCELPPGPATRKHIAGYGEALASDARLPEGCGVEIRPGSHRGGFIAAVATVNRLGSADDREIVKLPYPADYSPRSVLDPIELGEHRDSSIAGVLLRESSALITGRKRGGKTNLLDVLTLGIGRCRDALNWHIDLNGGGMSQLWLHPWLEGETDRPAIDWAAATPEEALLMTTVALAIALDRKSSYRTLKAKANVKLLPISPGLPEIVLSVDEGAEALSPTNTDPIARQIRANLEEIQRIGGNEAVNPVVSSLRPTQDMISPQILKQSAVKMALYGLDEADLGHLYGWNKGISMDDLPTKGCAFLGVENAPPSPLKVWFLEPEQIRQAAVAIAAIRPDLDAAGQDVANGTFEIDIYGDRNPVTLTDIYAGRHDRMRKAFTGQDSAIPAGPAARPQTTAAAKSAAAGGPDLRILTGGAASWPEPLSAKATPKTPAMTSASEWPDPIPSRTATTATTSTGSATATLPARPAAAQLPAARPVPELIRRALEVFDEANDDRLHSETLAKALGLTPHALSKLVRSIGIRSLEHAFERGGVERRGYARDDFAKAAEAIARGELQVPADLAAWTAA